MPMYSYACPCGHSDLELRSMANATPMGDCIACPACGKITYKRLPDLAHTDLHEFAEPIEMYSVAVNSIEEARELKVKCPDADISDDPANPLCGVPIARNRKAKLQVLEATGFRERG